MRVERTRNKETMNAPTLHIGPPRKIIDDGHHNAFTDLCRFRDKLYLTYRRCPEGHMLFASSQIVILASDDDGQTWREVFAFNAAPRDLRDPHFLVFKNRLFVYSGAWLVPPPDSPRTLNDHLGFAAYSDDGQSWHGPQVLEGTYGHYIWRAAAHNDTAYLCGRRRKGYAPGEAEKTDRTQIESALLSSDDGLVWKYSGLFVEEYGDETAFFFQEGGELVALARGADALPARICRARPPYNNKWTRTHLDRNVGGPLLVQWGEHCLVGGRKSLDPQNPRTTLYWLVDDQLEEIGELPSGGDNSYPGFVQLDEKRALLSYYSSHEGSGSGLPPSAIYLSELRLD